MLASILTPEITSLLTFFTPEPVWMECAVGRLAVAHQFRVAAHTFEAVLTDDWAESVMSGLAAFS